jgi:hypothetical protein
LASPVGVNWDAKVFSMSKRGGKAKVCSQSGLIPGSIEVFYCKFGVSREFRHANVLIQAMTTILMRIHRFRGVLASITQVVHLQLHF